MPPAQEPAQQEPAPEPPSLRGALPAPPRSLLDVPPDAVAGYLRANRAPAAADAAAVPGFRALLPTPGGASASLLSAGADCCVRLWNARRPEQSYVVCGPVPQTVDQKPLTQMPMYYERTLHRGVPVVREHLSASLPPEAVDRDLLARTGRPFVVSGARNCHDDAINDLATVHLNDTILLSASRDGVVKGWR